MRTIAGLFILSGLILFPRFAQAQLLSLSGYVKNFITGKPVENATIYEANTGIGTISNADGYYKLLLQKGKQELKVTSPGCQTYNYSFIMASDTIISVDLKSSNLSEKTVAKGNMLKNDSVSEQKKPSIIRKR